MSGPSGPVQVEFDPREGKGQFTAREHGMHEVLVTNEGEAVKVDICNIYYIYYIYYLHIQGAPHYIRSMPNSKKDYDGIEPCAVGSTVEVLVSNAHSVHSIYWR